MITPEEFAQRMRDIARMGDEESAHSQADDLLCEVLKQHGYGVGVEIFQNMPKWYA